MSIPQLFSWKEALDRAECARIDRTDQYAVIYNNPEGEFIYMLTAGDQRPGYRTSFFTTEEGVQAKLTTLGLHDLNTWEPMQVDEVSTWLESRAVKLPNEV